MKQRTDLAEIVTIDKEIMHGTPCFTDARVPVQTLLDYLEGGEFIEQSLPIIPGSHAGSFKCARDLDIEVAQYRRSRLRRAVVEKNLVAVSPQPWLAANELPTFPKAGERRHWKNEANRGRAKDVEGCGTKPIRGSLAKNAEKRRE